LAGVDVYVSGSPTASKAVLMISDIYGWKAPLFRKLADTVASAGFYVVAPDYFNGDAITDIADFPQWLSRHPPAGSVELTYTFVKALKERGMHSVGIVGFCWGAKVTALSGKKKHVNAIVQCHPSLAEASDYQEMAVPFSVLAAPTDGIGELKDVFKMKRKQVRLYVKIFTQVRHGWTVRYDETDKQAVKKARKAHMLVIKWLRKHL
jgi:dienelactone hydrolase